MKHQEQRRRHALTLCEKLDMIAAVETRGATGHFTPVQNVAKSFNVSASCVYNVLKQRDELRELVKRIASVADSQVTAKTCQSEDGPRILRGRTKDLTEEQKDQLVAMAETPGPNGERPSFQVIASQFGISMTHAHKLYLARKQLMGSELEVTRNAYNHSQSHSHSGKRVASREHGGSEVGLIRTSPPQLFIVAPTTIENHPTSKAQQWSVTPTQPNLITIHPPLPPPSQNHGTSQANEIPTQPFVITQEALKRLVDQLNAKPLPKWEFEEPELVVPMTTAQWDYRLRLPTFCVDQPSAFSPYSRYQ